MKKELDKNAYVQSYVIINYLLQTGEIVVSENLMNNIELNIDNSFKFNINDLNKIELLPDTEKILTDVYMENIATSEEKEEIKELVSKLRKIIKNEPIEETQTNLSPLNLTELKWTEKFKIAIKKLLYIVNHTGKTNTNLDNNIKNDY